jgi:hypothetical protein
MAWFKVDDKLHSHPKWVRLSLAARGLWITAGTWSADQETDAVVPKHMLRAFGARSSHAAELVDAGLWEEHRDGWAFHDWTDYQFSRAQNDAKRLAARERMARVRDAGSHDVRANGKRTDEAQHARARGDVRANFANPVPVPEPEPVKN